MAKEINLLAVDLGASNGRTILGKFDGKKLELEVTHNFPNGGEYIGDNFYWNILGLYSEIKTGLKKAVEISDGDIISMGIDTWGVDYGLLDKNGDLLSMPYHYRDSRTNDMEAKVFEKIDREKVYQETGIQFMAINTLYQIYTDLINRPWVLDSTESFLFIPDLLNYFLTAKKYNELTIASTSQMFNPHTNKWSDEIFEKLDLPIEIMQEIIQPGNKIGNLLENVKKECAINNEISVIAVGSHDTASAVAATPLIGENSIYISSGTWSLLGIELDEPLINKKSLEENFTNELGVGGKVRYLKNITGLWLIQECKRIWDREGLNLSYSEISKAAEEAEAFIYRVNPDDPLFVAPDNMVEAIKEYCRKTDQKIPETVGEIARGIYESLAFAYGSVIDRLEEMLDKEINTINMVGGGIQAEILCQYTADLTSRRVLAGPIEATAIGNILTQLIGLGEVRDLSEAREIVRNSIELKEYLPRN
ncbi:rhamnulokinase [Natronospora cellulosivora (SeqCode)]